MDTRTVESIQDDVANAVISALFDTDSDVGALGDGLVDVAGLDVVIRALRNLGFWEHGEREDGGVRRALLSRILPRVGVTEVHTFRLTAYDGAFRPRESAPGAGDGGVEFVTTQVRARPEYVEYGILTLEE